MSECFQHLSGFWFSYCFIPIHCCNAKFLYFFLPWENKNAAAAISATAAAATASPTAAWIFKDPVPHMVGYLKWVRDEFPIILRY